MKAKIILLIRPGETDWNKIGRIQGQVAIPLNDHGCEQAKRIAKFMRVLNPAALYSSDARRAKDTAEIIADTLNMTPVYDRRLRERHMGNWQGLVLHEIKSWYPEGYAALRKNSVEYQITGGESWNQVTDRVIAALEDILKEEHDSDTIAIITHTTAIRTLISKLVEDANAYIMEFSNMSVSTLMKNDEDNWYITQNNDVSHLEGMPTGSVIEVEDLRNDSGH